MPPNSFQRLSKAGLDKLQATAETISPPYPENRIAYRVEQVKKEIYALAWSLDRIGEAGRRILRDEKLTITGPNDVRSLSDRISNSELDDLAFWEDTLESLGNHKGTIQLERVKGWVYKTMVGLWRQGKDGRSALRRAGLSLRGCEVRCQTQAIQHEPSDQLMFWEGKLQYLEDEYASLHRPIPKSAPMLEFISSDSEVEEDNAEQALAEEYIRSWHGRRKDIEVWAEATPTGTEVLRSPCVDSKLGDTQAGPRESSVARNSLLRPPRCTKRKRSASTEDEDRVVILSGNRSKRQMSSEPRADRISVLSDVCKAQPAVQRVELPSSRRPRPSHAPVQEEKRRLRAPSADVTTKPVPPSVKRRRRTRHNRSMQATPEPALRRSLRLAALRTRNTK
ncbi:hypothetical protein CDEST_09244 [Colletotrichum destructivum]|uniref:Uncharacterized protein n=1 Tax=Colletotrichum destructivum TaxID=34406 RepID=A0AAX4ILE8_9PEZI|nr:hypothetical protein CDEST_09244 [Colletotrichum destructivum]